MSQGTNVYSNPSSTKSQESKKIMIIIRHLWVMLPDSFVLELISEYRFLSWNDFKLDHRSTRCFLENNIVKETKKKTLQRSIKTTKTRRTAEREQVSTSMDWQWHINGTGALYLFLLIRISNRCISGPRFCVTESWRKLIDGSHALGSVGRIHQYSWI